MRRPPGLVNSDEDYFKPLCDGDVLKATLPQRIIVLVTFLLVGFGLSKAATALAVAADPLWQTLPCCALAVILAVEFADFGTGVYHWSVDNYGSAQTPVVGKQIEAFQGHHEEPWTITYRDFCNNCFPTCIATMPFLIAFDVFVASPYVLLWGVIACTGIAFCQEFHKWSHTLKSQCHPVVNWLQERGLLVTRKAHLRHHKRPFDNNYCIVTGHMNPILDNSGFFQALQSWVRQRTGVSARCETGTRFDYLLDKRKKPSLSASPSET